MVSRTSISHNMGRNVGMKVNRNPLALLPATSTTNGPTESLKFGWEGVPVLTVAVFGHVCSDIKWDTFLPTYEIV